MGAAARQVTFNTPPLTFNRDAALQYTGLAPKLFTHLETSGSLTGRRIGRNGELVYLREHLDKVTANLFGGTSTDIDSEFEGLGG
ncbi:hypothetical protein [Sphingobium sp. KCTC 72723]|uniref:hypothetical protein n=1 Tax=Sphingobium sp. KCTC 72723 TaxID=2733867 RepID=UPI00165EA5D1|nr:hypothetical protein [Sphingobium sp. KCTC 72723]